jgi:hypothetical protein
VIAPMAWAWPSRGTSRRYTTAKIVPLAITAGSLARLTFDERQAQAQAERFQEEVERGLRRVVARVDRMQDVRAGHPHLGVSGGSAETMPIAVESRLGQQEGSR